MLDEVPGALAKFLFDTVIGRLLSPLFYGPGWLLLKALTLGHYPPQAPSPAQRDFVAVMGFVGILLAVLIPLLLE